MIPTTSRARVAERLCFSANAPNFSDFRGCCSVFSDSFSASSASGTRTIDARAIDNC